jgi:1,4-dihydroxy-2-naphthoate octaprenyltransferase
MIRLFAWVLSVIYLVIIGIPTAIGLLIILQIISIAKFISNVRKKKKKA